MSNAYLHPKSNLLIDRLDDVEKVCVATPPHHAHIPDADVPTVAAELLKAAGRTELAEMIEAVEADRSVRAEREAAETKLQERRDALASDLSGDDTLRYEHIRSSLRRAINRIIELEDGASRD